LRRTFFAERYLEACLRGWLVLYFGGSLAQVFLALGIALVAFGAINATAVAKGAWFARG
jgi:hypothetical protein